MPPVQITSYSGNPAGIAIGLGLFALIGSQSNFHRGSFAFDNLLSRLPASWVQNVANWQRFTLITLLVLHVGEAFYMDQSRLQKHGVRRFSPLWFKWILTHLAIGFPNFTHFDKLVQEKERVR